MTTTQLASIVAAAQELVMVTGEIDNDGRFLPCPQASLSQDERDRIAPHIEMAWRGLVYWVGSNVP